MGDVGHELTDLELAMLESEIGAVYKDASSDVGKMAQDYFEKLKIREQKMREHLDAGDITKEEYQSWWMAQLGRGKWFEDMRDKLAERMTSANEEAMRCVNDAMPSIYALNRNYAAYTIEQASDTVDFNLWDEGTVRRLLRDNPETMPYYPPNRAVERGIDLAWGKQKITDTVKSGILQGLSIPQMTKYLQGTITSMNKSSATRAARTAVTSAENGGRMDTFNAASSMGIKMEKEWMSAEDNRVRESHAHLNGVHVPNSKKFPNGLRYPGDPEGRAAEVYNCRCTLVSWFPELNEKRTKNTVESYRKWEEEKRVFKKTEEDSIFVYGDRKMLMSEKQKIKVLKSAEDELSLYGYKLEGFDRYDGDAETIENIVSALKDMGEKYPEIASKLTVKYGHDDDNRTFAWYEINNSKIVLNDIFFYNWNNLEKHYLSDKLKGNSPKGTNAKAVIYHEFGHAFGYFNGYDKTKSYITILKKIVGEHTGIQYPSPGLITYFLDNNLCKNAHEYSSIVKYGETIAESFAEVYNSKDPRWFSIKFLEEVGAL